MPNKPRDGVSVRTVRIPDPLWEKARRRAAERDETVSEAIRRFLERYSR